MDVESLFDKVSAAVGAAMAKAEEERKEKAKAEAEKHKRDLEARNAQQQAENACHRGHADAQFVESSSLPDDGAKRHARALCTAMDEAFMAKDWSQVHKVASDLWGMAEEIRAKRRRAGFLIVATVAAVLVERQAV